MTDIVQEINTLSERERVAAHGSYWRAMRHYAQHGKLPRGVETEELRAMMRTLNLTTEDFCADLEAVKKRILLEGAAVGLDEASKERWALHEKLLPFWEREQAKLIREYNAMQNEHRSAMRRVDGIVAAIKALDELRGSRPELFGE